MNEQSEIIDIIDRTDEIKLILRCDSTDLANCVKLKENFKVFKNEEIKSVVSHGVYKCYNNYYAETIFSFYFDADMNVYFLISPFNEMLCFPKDVTGLLAPTIILDNVYGKISVKNGKAIEITAHIKETDDNFNIYNTHLKSSYLDNIYKIFPYDDIDEHNAIITYMTEWRQLARQMAFDKELTNKFFVKFKDIEYSAMEWYILEANKKYKGKLDRIIPARQLILDLESLEAKLKMIEDTYTNIEKISSRLSETDMIITTTKINKMLTKISTKVSSIEKHHQNDDKLDVIIKEQFDENTNIFSTTVKTTENTQHIIIQPTKLDIATENEIFLKILSEKLVSYNQRNPQYLYDHGLLQITQNKINEDKANTNKMKRLYDLYINGTYSHKYNWNTYFDSYMKSVRSGYDIDHVLLSNGSKIGDDIIGGFLIISNNARSLNGSEYYTDNTFKSRQGKEFTQVFITDTYQYSKNSDVPISFSYYLLTHHSRICNTDNTITQNGWCATQDISKVYEYMLYNWKYHEQTNVTNILYYDCEQVVNPVVKYIPEHVSFINDSHYLIIGYNWLYQSIFQSSLAKIQVDFPVIHAKLNEKYGKKKLHAHITDEIKRSKEDSHYSNPHMESFMLLANVIIKSLQLFLPSNKTYSKQELVNLLLLNNINDQYLFIKIKKLMESGNDIIIIFVNFEENTYVFCARNVSDNIDVQYTSDVPNAPVDLLENIKNVLKEMLQNKFYEIISNTDVFEYLKSHMIKSINDIFSDEPKNILASYTVLDIIASTTSSNFLKEVKTNKLYEAVYNVIKNALAIGTFLTRYYEINKQYNYKPNFRRILETINGSIISKEDLNKIAPTFLDETYKQKYGIFINNLIELIHAKFKYRDEIHDFLNIQQKQSTYIQLLASTEESPYGELLKIFKETEFGVEFESCFGVTCDQEINMQKRLNTSYDKVSIFIDEFNKLSNKYIPLNEQKKQNVNFTSDRMNPSSEVYSTWRLHEDVTVRCTVPKTCSVEVVTPILQFSDSDNKASGKDTMWKIISRKLYRENFGKRYEYSDGLFFLTATYNFLLNNNIDKKYKPDIKIKTHANQTQGMHLHVSNPHMMLETFDNNKFCGIGVLKMIFFIRMFAWYEHVIRNFLDRPPALQSSWAKSIYYEREQYLTNNSVGIAHKSYIEQNTYQKLKLYLQDPESNQTFIAEMFEYYRDTLLAKCGGLYRGAFAIRIYNERGKCHLTNTLKNLCCKGHLEIRLHHSTDDFAEVYNWILFINLFLSKCVTIVDKIYNARNENYEEVFTNIMGKYEAFLTEGDHSDPTIMAFMFNELFDDFIQNDTLKTFYRKRSKEQTIKNDTKKSITNLELHSPSIFSQNGELKDVSMLKSMMGVFPLDSTSVTTRDDLIKLFKELDAKEESDYNLLT